MLQSLLKATLVAGLSPLLSAQGPTQFQNHNRMMLPQNGNRAFHIGTGDLDGDGDIDVVLANLSGTRGAELFINDGRGNFSEESTTRFPIANVYGGAVAVLDVDGDKDLDVVIGRGTDSLFLNDGKGKFSDGSANLPSGSENTYDIVAGDVDFDGDPDLLFVNTSASSRLLLNDGKGKFTDSTGTTLPSGIGGSWGAAFADVDGDADLDIVFSTSASNAGPRIFINSNFFGKYVEETGTRLPAVTGAGRKVLIRDFDGDFDKDIFLCNYNTADQLLINDGKGKFTDASGTNLPASSSNSGNYFSAAGDIDADGDLDLVIGNWSGSGTANHILLNDGKGKFSDATVTRLTQTIAGTTALALADLDCDGDLDIFAGNWNSADQIAFNRHRHAYAPKQPTINSTYVLELGAAPGYAKNLQVILPAVAAGTLTQAVQLPGVRGKLGIDPTLMAMLTAIPITNPGALHQLRIPVPNDSRLVGAKFYIQTLVNDTVTGNGFSNVFFETIK